MAVAMEMNSSRYTWNHHVGNEEREGIQNDFQVPSVLNGGDIY